MILSSERRISFCGLLSAVLWGGVIALGFHPVHTQQHVQLRNLKTGEQVRRSFPNIDPVERLVDALCAETHEE